MFIQSGYKHISARGIATIIQPQNEDFDPQNKQRGSLSTRLENKEYFDLLFEIESKVGKTQSAVNRAMNILMVGEK